MEEIWKDIIGYEGCYQASNLGNIKSLSRFVNSKNNSLRKISERILSPKIKENGYCSIQLKNKGKEHYIHRLVLQAFVGVSNLDTDHINRIRNDNRLENLEYVTPRENSTRKKSNKQLPVGVTKYGKNNKYRSLIYINKKRIHLGCFETIEDAHSAYKNKLNTII